MSNCDSLPEEGFKNSPSAAAAAAVRPVVKHLREVDGKKQTLVLQIEQLSAESVHWRQKDTLHFSWSLPKSVATLNDVTLRETASVQLT